MAHCTGHKINDDGTFYCDATPVAAYTWHGVPFNYKGKPGAAVCSGHEAYLQKFNDRYPSLTLIERIAEPTHAFEKSGLGRAPFRFIGCEERRGPIRMPDGSEVGTPGQPMGTCAHCGTGIAVCCTIQSADGKTFIVGNVCVGKTGDKGLIKTTRRAINARLAEGRRAKAVKRKAWIEANLERAKPIMSRFPSPSGFKNSTQYDWAVWMTKNAGDAGRKRVEAKMLEALGEAK